MTKKIENYSQELEIIANNLLLQSAENVSIKPNYSNRDFMNTIIIFQTALIDKMYDCMDKDDMEFNDRLDMAESCGTALRKLVHTYTGLDPHNIKEFL